MGTILQDLITNVTAVRLVQPLHDVTARLDVHTTPLESALVQDAVKVLVRADFASESTSGSELDVIKQVTGFWVSKKKRATRNL